jgi:hypothetical protein
MFWVNVRMWESWKIVRPEILPYDGLPSLPQETHQRKKALVLCPVDEFRASGDGLGSPS